MSNALSQKILSELSLFIEEHMGLSFPPERWPDLERGIVSAAKEFGFKDVLSCMKWLRSASISRREIETLACHLTVGETFFFREKESFEILEQEILPRLIRDRNLEKRLRIWSAGCSTGEEPYSIAISLMRTFPDIHDWNITLLATDINSNALKKAAKGVYSEWSFRESPFWLKESYFRKNREGHYEILPEIRKRVTFTYLNLAEDPYPSLMNNTNAMDLIFCRNVLMYFTPDKGKAVLLKFYRALLEEGWLIVSPTDATQMFPAQFTPKRFPHATLYQKSKEPLEEIPPPLVIDSRERVQEEFVISQHHAGESPLPLYKGEAYTPQSTTTAQVFEKLQESIPQPERGDQEVGEKARFYANQGHLSDALEWCEKGIAADKLNLDLYYLRALILEEEGESEKAISTLHQVLYLDPNFIPAHYALGNLLLRRKNYGEAERHFQLILSLLADAPSEEVLPELEGITAGRLREIIRATEYWKSTEEKRNVRRVG
ncbi:MAG: chemotaxis protein CheR [Deltaproteobacteria bacterium]|nr:chemotaxis protein CheR [Deltaproteobacteria bacterium]